MWRRLLIICMLAAACDAPAADAAPSGADATAQPSAAARRIALVIGNAAYADAALVNPVRDARAIGAALAALGFEVAIVENADRQRMDEAVAAFHRRLRAGGTGLFYFAGHGLQAGGEPLLAAVDADRHLPLRLFTQSLPLRSVLAGMAQPRAGKLNLVILDACLDSPFERAGAGARLPAPPDRTLIAYATAPGAGAADGKRHGLYTAELLRALAQPGRDLRQALRDAEAGVQRISAERQLPWTASSLPPGVRLPAGLTGALAQAPREEREEFAGPLRGVLPKDSAEQYELTFWESIKDSTHASDYEAYLQSYPNGRFAALARARIERLRAAAPKSETPPAASRPPPAKPADTPPEAPAARKGPEPQQAAPPAKAPRARAAPPAKEAQEPALSAAPMPPPAEKAAKAPAGGEIKDCPNCPVLVSLPRGSFVMGNNTSDPSEKPAHHVSINAPFAIGKYEVTVEQWNACADAGACPRVGGSNGGASGKAPVRDVSWDDTQLYVKWISQTTGQSYRLPTEAEWEYAARGGTSTRYWWGEQMKAGNADCKECGGKWNKDAPADVGSFPANPYGLHDVNGGVWEWVSDCWHNNFKGAPADGKNWDAPNCSVRVIRGGSWREGATYMVSSTRFKYDASVRHSQNGFRVARDIK